MSDNLTTLISKIQAILGDNGNIFTTATCTAAIRQALAEWNLRVPIYATAILTGVNNQYKYELSEVASNALDILDVLLQGDNENELDISIDFDSFTENERVFFRLRHPITGNNSLIVRYTLDQTINGLDGATESTIPVRHNQAMIDGGAYFAIFIRAVTRVESINLSRDQTDNYRELATYFGNAFALRTAQAARTKTTPVSEPDPRAWQDQYHNWDQ